MKPSIVIAAGTVAVCSAAALAATGPSWTPSTLVVNHPSEDDLARTANGKLRKTQEAFTNEQGVVKFFADGVHGLYVEMRTGTLENGQKPTDRMQGACTPIQLYQASDGSVGLMKLTGEHFISDNKGQGYRNFNKPELMPINGGKNMLVMFNHRPNNNTERYAKVLDQSCNEVPITDAQGNTRKQVRIMAKTNDNCDMHQTGEGPCDVVSDAGGATHLVCWAGCNGNGSDNGWLNDVTVQCQNGAAGASSCQITKNFDVALCLREERSRGRCTVADEDPNTAVCTWTEGNTQPQRDGTWIAAVDVSPNGPQGEDVRDRILWKEQIDGRKTQADGTKTYSARAQHVRLMSVAQSGALQRTNMIAFQSGDTMGNNRDNRKGGRYVAMQVAVIQATRTGMSYVIPKTNVTDLLLGIDGTHLTMCPALYGQGSFMPGFSLMQGSANGGGASAPVVKTVGIDLTNKKLVDLGMHILGGSYDRALYSKMLGENPNDQGRNFSGCTMVKNPFAATPEFLVAHALTGKDPQYVGRPEMKPSSYVTLLPLAAGYTAPAAAPGPAPAPGPMNPGGGAVGGNGSDPATTPAANNPQQSSSPSMWGCAVGGEGGGSVLVALIGLALVIRRRRHA